MKMQKLMQSGPANAFPQNPNGSLQHAEVCRANPTSGEMNSAQTENGWLTPLRVTFQTAIAEMTATLQPLPLKSFRPTAMAFMTWQATSGNGPVIGILPTITHSLSLKE